MAESGISLRELVERLGGALRGDANDAEHRITRVGTLGEAQPEALSFLSNPHYRHLLANTRAGCVILAAADAEACPAPCIVTNNPYLYYARAVPLIYPPDPIASGCHPEATVSSRAEIASSASISVGAVLGAGAKLGEAVYVGPGCVIGERVSIGRGTRLNAGVTVIAAATIGEDCILHPGAVIGADGFGLAWNGANWERVPQLGSVIIGNHVDVGANTTIDRGTIGNTVIEDDVKLDNLIQIGHNVCIGAHTAIAGCTGISGSSTVGRNCLIGGQVGIAGHLTIVDGTVITGKTLVNHSIHRPGQYSGALPMDDSARWHRNSARFRRLDQLARRLRKLEQYERDMDL